MELDPLSKKILSTVVEILNDSQELIEQAITSSGKALEKGDSNSIALVTELSECAMVGKEATIAVSSIPQKIKAVLDSGDLSGLGDIDTFTFTLREKVRHNLTLAGILTAHLLSTKTTLN